MSNVKFYLGPMSKNIVDSVIEYNNVNGETFGFIPSRRQVEYNGGYVNKWTNETFSQYAKSKNKNTIIQRDHGGPAQGYMEDDGRISFQYDAKYFDLIHIDPWKKYPDIEDGICETVDIIKFCLNINHNIEFEVGTEEAIRKFDVDELETLLDILENQLSESEFQKIKFVVVQSGVGLDLGRMRNIGNYNPDRLHNMIQIAHRYNKLTKEHNGDYLSYREIQDRFSIGLDAINIAPELGQIETCAILELFNGYDKMLEEMFQLCHDSKRWEKWVPQDYNPIENKVELIRICGHYIFSKDRFVALLEEFSNESGISKKNIFIKIRKKITDHLQALQGV